MRARTSHWVPRDRAPMVRLAIAARLLVHHAVVLLRGAGEAGAVVGGRGWVPLHGARTDGLDHLLVLLSDHLLWRGRIVAITAIILANKVPINATQLLLLDDLLGVGLGREKVVQIVRSDSLVV